MDLVWLQLTKSLDLNGLDCHLQDVKGFGIDKGEDHLHPQSTSILPRYENYGKHTHPYIYRECPPNMSYNDVWHKYL